MRELYAVELCGTEETDNGRTESLVRDWAKRHVPDGDEDATRLTIEETTDGQHLITLVQVGDGDTSQLWRSEVAVGPATSRLHATIRVRLGTGAGAPLAPMDYDFGTPAIVRTILREQTVIDAGQRVHPTSVELGRSDIPALLDWLTNEQRRLPVVVVSRTPDTGQTLVDVGALAKELAAVAHVRVLSSTHAGWGLTEAVGAPLAVWDGAVRLYFPGFSPEDAPFRHRVWFPDHVSNGLVQRLRSWLGTLSSARTPEHPVYEQLRADRRRRVAGAADAAEEVKLLYEIIDDLETDQAQSNATKTEQQLRIAELASNNERLTADVETQKQNLVAMAQAMGSRNREAPPDDGPLTVAGAMDAIEELLATRYYRGRVTITPEAVANGRRFRQYDSPEDLLRAVKTVMEAAVLVHDGRLGTTPMAFFNARGYGYAAQPEPHLKVDESTSPDQCLRIYWSVDDADRLWTVTDIGLHH